MAGQGAPEPRPARAGGIAGWVRTHQLQAGGVGVAGVVVLALYVRSRKSSTTVQPSTADTSATDLQSEIDQLAGELSALGAGSVQGTQPGSGVASGSPNPSATGGGAVADPGATAPAPGQLVTQPMQAITPAPGSLAALLLRPQPGAPILGSETIQNPSGYAAQQVAENTNPATGLSSYAPSASDLLAEQPGGLQRYLVGKPGVAGGEYTVDNSTVGSGPVVPLNERIPGERYDASGRVIQ